MSSVLMVTGDMRQFSAKLDLFGAISASLCKVSIGSFYLAFKMYEIDHLSKHDCDANPASVSSLIIVNWINHE